jgi:hypothetical protein
LKAGNRVTRPAGSLVMAVPNNGWDSQPESQALSAGKGRVSNQVGSTAANWRTKGKMAMSAAQGMSPPS